MTKAVRKGVPRLLTINRKRNRSVKISKATFALFNRYRNEFLRRLISVDETWILHNIPETKQLSKQWIFHGGLASKMAVVGPTAIKIMAKVFGLYARFFTLIIFKHEKQSMVNTMQLEQVQQQSEEKNYQDNASAMTK